MFNVQTQGRTFSVEGDVKGNANLAEFSEAFDRVIKMAKAMGIRLVRTGFVTVLGHDYQFEEVTSSEEIEHNERTARMLKLLDGAFKNTGGGYEVSDPRYAEIFLKVREGEMEVDEGVQRITALRENAAFESRQKEQDAYMDIAQSWAKREGLSVAEACNGVAYEAYRMHTLAVTSGAPNHYQIGDTKLDVWAEYRKRYDQNNAESIKNKLMRNAKDLFD